MTAAMLRYVLSTSRLAAQVFVVDFVVTFAMSYLASSAVATLLMGVPFLRHQPNTAVFALMAFMAVVGGSIGASASYERDKNSMTHVRSVRATLVWSIVTPVLVIVLLAALADSLTDVRGMLIIMSIIGPAASVYGYRFMGFVPSDLGRVQLAINKTAKSPLQTV